jgi:hypothetical protein
MDGAIRQAMGRPFAWGRHDCALFACDVVKAMTGVDMAWGLRGEYRTARGAYGLLKRLCGGGLREFAQLTAARLGKEAVPPLMAQRGDVVLVPVQDGEALGICSGRHVLVASKEGGLLPIPVSSAVAAWRI